ncbi:multicopper oxidase domain-containing protein [Streptomyces sp. NPDC019224]|uniref:multicopper oxidase family protein n=1 Tax=Streptomyces sp. NPDC019224 TaxID=3154484 RepID=UPI0033FBFEC0
MFIGRSPSGSQTDAGQLAAKSTREEGMWLTRRDFGLLSAAACASVAGLAGASTAAAEPRATSRRTVTQLEKYVDPMPRPPLALPGMEASFPGTAFYEITMLQCAWQFHRDLGKATTWGYWATDPENPEGPMIGMGYLGPTIITKREAPVVVNYRNHLPTTHLFQPKVDDMRRAGLAHGIPPDVNVPTTVHLHGNFTPPQSDGLAEQWYTPDGKYHGEKYFTLEGGQANEAIYAYPNNHRSTLFWYHDHAMAFTRLNVYAGLAALYVVRDDVETGLNLPRGDFEVPLVLQDKSFNEDGSLRYDLDVQDGGEIPVVNGKAYPFLAIEPRRYRFRVVNASNSRFWRLQLKVGKKRMPFWVIGGDSGFLPDRPVKLKSTLLAPAERLDLIIDFSEMPQGAKVTLSNFDAPVHFPDGGGPEIGEIMQFQVTKPLSCADESTPPKAIVLPAIPRLEPTPGLPRREFVMLQPEGDVYTPENPYLINALPFMAPNEDFIEAGTTEIWEYINLTHDAHPMHVHLVNFQIINRQKFDQEAYQRDYEEWVDAGRKPETKPDLSKYLRGRPILPDLEERGPKDTVKTYTGMVTRVIHRFNVPAGIPNIPGSGTTLPAEYMHHCHILEHEDNDKMRPWVLVEDGSGFGASSSHPAGHAH